MVSAYFSFGPDSIQGKLGITESSREANISTMLGRIFTWTAPLQARQQEASLFKLLAIQQL